MSRTPLSLLPTTEAVRADAARNRERILVAAREMLDEHGADGITMDALARRAGVGKGTVFRRFGSRAGLLRTLVDDIEVDFQTAFLSGPPPLGPGAPPLDRLIAYGRARIELLQTQGPLIRASEGDAWSGYDVPARGAAHLHLVVLLRQAGVPGDLQVLGFHLLAALDATLIEFETVRRGMDAARLADGWESHVRLLCANGG
jgi:AcrR family transcriptional regulator